MRFFRYSVELLALAMAGPALAQTVSQITSFPVDRLGEYALDDAGSAVVAVTTADPFGANPNHEYQAVSWTGTGAGSALTRFGGLTTSVSVSDDGQWIAFVSVADPLGESGSNDPVAFVQSADGSVLRQLGLGGDTVRISGSGNRVVSGRNVFDLASNTSTPIYFEGHSWSISDDGHWVVYSSDGGVYRINVDEWAWVQLTSPDIEDATGAVISGNGQRVTYESGGQIYVMDVSGGEPFLIGPGHHPSITDDGNWVYYSASDGDNMEIHRSLVENPIPQVLTRTSPPLSNDWPQVSGSGNRVAFVRYGTVASDPDARVLMVMNSSGGAVEQLGTAEVDWKSRKPDITSDGRRIVFLGGSGEGPFDVFRVQADGTDLVEVTHGVEALNPSVADDGETVVFQSSLDLTGDNPCGTAHVFRIGADGSGLAQLSPSGSCSVHDYPVISRDGSTVVYRQDETALFAVPAAGGAPTLFAMGEWVSSNSLGLSRDGRLAVYHDPRHVFLAQTDGSGEQQIGGGQYNAWYSDVSADGSRVAYSLLDFDPFVLDNQSAVWLYEPETGIQTHLGWTNAYRLRMSGSGAYVYYWGNWTPVPKLHRSQISPWEDEAFHGLRDKRTAPPSRPEFAVDGIGRVAVSWSVNWTGENPDLNQEIWLVDFEGTPRWDIEKTTPALVRFSPDPFGTAYDVIRGDLANLGLGVDGTVDLDEVVCVADDSSTNSAVDPEGPEPNQGFFYLFRATGGSGWGASSSGAPRVPGAGGCP